MTGRKLLVLARDVQRLRQQKLSKAESVVVLRTERGTLEIPVESCNEFRGKTGIFATLANSRIVVEEAKTKPKRTKKT